MQFRTDMAIERREIYRRADKLDKEIPGLETDEKQIDENTRVTKVKIINEQGEKTIGKPQGTYITIDLRNLKIATEDEIERAAISMSNELQKMINEHIGLYDEIFVVGLGNSAVTPDSLRS